MLIGTAAAYDIPGTLVVYILAAADISSAGVGMPAMRTATTPLPTSIYITRAYWCIKTEILSTAIPGVCYARTRSYLVLVRTCVPGRL